jgi:hypothetical protein
VHPFDKKEQSREETQNPDDFVGGRPYAKTGGLADVVGALPQVLQRLGHEVIVVMPRYGSIDGQKFGLRRQWDSMGVWMGNVQEWCAVDVADNDGVPTYFIEHNNYFARPGLYHDDNFNDYTDNPRRFAFLTRAGSATQPGFGLCARHRPRSRLADGVGVGLSQNLALERPAPGRRGQCADDPQHRLPGQISRLRTTTILACNGTTSRRTNSRTTARSTSSRAASPTPMW